MNDMTATIVAKSDQINASDLIGAPRTVTVREVRIKAGDDQPVSILIEGDNKAFRPCKGVRRLLVRVWGPDATKYIGQSMTLFCDPTVTWAGKPEGGIRVSHMTGLDEKIVEFMRTSREKTKPYTVEPLALSNVGMQGDPAKDAADKIIANIGKAPDAAKLNAYLAGKPAPIIAGWRQDRPELAAAVDAAVSVRTAQFAPAIDDDDPFTDDAPAYAGAVQQLEHMIDSATSPEAVEQAQGYFETHRAALPDDVAADMDARIAARGFELAGA